jgi:acyl transferase domain-containing protein
MSESNIGASLPAIAIIGMAGRFPGARTLDEFWQNLRDGVESISTFSDAELDFAGGNAADAKLPGYVKSRAILDGVEMFDASFFGYTAREAELSDPQQRLFLQCAYEALEAAGYAPERYRGAIGVFGGAGFNHYLFVNLLSNRELIASSGFMQTSIRNRNDHLTTNVAYKLNLKGPAITVQTACSTSLVAVHLACQSLIHYECDMALAGGVSISLPQKAGYIYQEGGILSPDGHCRAFDSNAQGTVNGNGAGMVLLKRLQDALDDRDHIEAVILGSAIGNDGSLKVGYTAPSIEGQSQVIAEAQLVAGVDPESISYIEAHGTGTRLGDPIEIAALTQAFRQNTEGRGFCAIGSLKTNVGHLDTAAGVAGLIKTVLSLKHRMLPPNLHFEKPNEEIDFQSSPFFVNAGLQDWRSHGPRRAGVSSFGIGGTNVHAIVQEAPALETATETRAHQLLLLSARTAPALQSACHRLADHLESHSQLDLADTAYTLQVGRREFRHRRALVCRDRNHAIEALRTADESVNEVQASSPLSVVFLFPGQGSQYVNMARGLYESEPVFRSHFEECLRLLRRHVEFDLHELLYPATENDDAAAMLSETSVTQPALFVIEYALARLWMEWGIQPEAMIGHSIGEYVTACLAGVLSLEDALTLVAARGRLMHALPRGGMLVVPLPEQEVVRLLNDQLSLAAVNASSFCVVSGVLAAIDKLERELAQSGVACRRLMTSHAFHSSMMDSILKPFADACRSVSFHVPRVPYISNVTGDWIRPEEATSPDYWVRHLRETVRFHAGLERLRQKGNSVFLEVGPGRSLSGLARAEGLTVLTSLRPASDSQHAVDDQAFLLATLGQLWSTGITVDWSAFYRHEHRRRVPLPLYPFEPQRYWIDPQQTATSSEAQSKQKNPLQDWLYTPTWKSMPLAQDTTERLQGKRCLLFCDRHGVGEKLAHLLQAAGAEVFTVERANRFAAAHGSFSIRPESAEDHLAVLRSLHERGAFPEKIIHLWNLVDSDTGEADSSSFWSPMFLAQAVGVLGDTPGFELLLLSNFLYDVTGNPVLAPQRATLLGPCRVIPQEYASITCRHIDFDIRCSEPLDSARMWGMVSECASTAADQIVTYRNGRRWVQGYEPVAVPSVAETLPVREKGTYFLTGGLGGVGLELAEELAQSAQARLALIARPQFVPREMWPQWLQDHAPDDAVSMKIRKLQQLERHGAEILLVSADVTSEPQMRAAIAETQQKFGRIHGVVHAAGVPGGGVIQRKTAEMAEPVLAAKVKGTLVLASLFKDSPLDFFVACSSRSAILGGFGQSDYCAANAFLDVFAQYSHALGGVKMRSINWGAWQSAGMLADQATRIQARETAITSGKTAKPAVHPLLQQRIASAEPDTFISFFSPATHWILDEHRIAGKAVMPGVAYLEMARAAVAQRAGSAVIEIRDAFFLVPLHVRDDETREVRAVLEPAGEGYAFRVTSQAAAAGQGDERQEYATAHVSLLSPSAAPKQDIEAIRSRCNPHQSIGREQVPAKEGFGPRWQSFQRAYVGADEALALLEFPAAFVPELQELSLHPALLDRAMAIGKEFLVKEGMYLPMSYRRLRIFRPLEPRIYVHVRYQGTGRVAPPTISFDLTLMNEQGEELVEIEGFTQKRIQNVAAQIRLATAAQEVMAEEGKAANSLVAQALQERLLYGITSGEGRQVFRHVLALSGLPQVIVSTTDFHAAVAEANSSRPVEQIKDHAPRASSQRMHPRPALQTEYQPPRNEAERNIADAWQKVLGLESIGVNDNYFDLGGDSVQAIQIITRVNQQGFSFTVQQLFQHQTVVELAAIASVDNGTGILPAQQPLSGSDEFSPAAFSLTDLDEARLRELQEMLDEDEVDEAGATAAQQTGGSDA